MPYPVGSLASSGAWEDNYESFKVLFAPFVLKQCGNPLCNLTKDNIVRFNAFAMSRLQKDYEILVKSQEEFETRELLNYWGYSQKNKVEIGDMGVDKQCGGYFSWTHRRAK